MGGSFLLHKSFDKYKVKVGRELFYMHPNTPFRALLQWGSVSFLVSENPVEHFFFDGVFH